MTNGDNLLFYFFSLISVILSSYDPSGLSYPAFMCLEQMWFTKLAVFLLSATQSSFKFKNVMFLTDKALLYL